MIAKWYEAFATSRYDDIMLEHDGDGLIDNLTGVDGDRCVSELHGFFLKVDDGTQMIEDVHSEDQRIADLVTDVEPSRTGSITDSFKSESC